MSGTHLTTISRDELAKRFEHAAPNNEDRSEGFALINVVGPDQFADERIPGSANIPQGHEEIFEQRFDKNKEIIVYCASPRCDASEKTARELVSRGFAHVFDYEAGMSDWRDAGHPVAGIASA